MSKLTYPKYANLCGWTAMLPARTPRAALNDDITVDYAVVGAGYTGVAAARCLHELDPQARLALIEATTVGEGSSARNSGFTTPDVLPRTASMEMADKARNQSRLFTEAFEWLQGIIRDNDIACDMQKVGSIRAAATEEGEATLRKVAEVARANNLQHTVLDRAGIRERIDAELAELAAHIDEHEATIAAENERFEALDAELAQHQEQAESLQLAFEDAERALGERREALRRDEREAQEASFAVRAAESSIERLDALIEQAIALGEQAQAERASLRAKLDELTDASARHALQEALEARTVAEQALAQARAQLDDLGHSLRAREESRLVAERAQEPLRQRLGKLQLDEQAARLNREQFAQSLAEAGLDEAAIEALRASLADAPRPSWLQGEVTRLSNAIVALGAVNLAALEELAQAEERKGFLDAQSSDLEEAIATLEDAIRKIDRETRELLQQTYDTVNGHFAKLFPELFGGGEARLILTGDEILDAGIQVLAQPPGKRNTSIQLLSGGEKALTAIALVFALFQLNPAPFCLLDEVDAPLDDANTERYCEMVRRMSDQTQFLFITHNKIAMELAQQLVGVTMQERGVSRIVAVDLDAAARYAEAA